MRDVFEKKLDYNLIITPEMKVLYEKLLLGKLVDKILN